MRSNWISLSAAGGLLVVLGIAGGCKGPDTADAGAPVRVTPMPKIDYASDAGLPLDTQSADPAKIKNLVHGMVVNYRQDPFSLTPQEKAYDTEQATERLVQLGGNMQLDYIPPPPPDDTPPAMEPQPYRRVSGILVGDAVLAIIEMGDGKPEIVRPGMYVPGTPWYVVSIDEEKVVLRRAGNVNPKTISVRLEARPPGGGGAPGAGGGFGPGGGPNGPPGAPGTPQMGGAASGSGNRGGGGQVGGAG
ncbi:MAG TPA: hypothetical protein VKT78_02220 [Fimbriimonadaceae bacterium]|nr:hypothetical protein [Fimbriimonadaceae bacterium]